MARDQKSPPPTNPTVRESQLAINRGPVYQGLAEELAKRLHALRLSGRDADYRVECGRLAQDADSVVGLFSAWGALSDDGKRHVVAEWQEVKARARKLGLEAL